MLRNATLLLMLVFIGIGNLTNELKAQPSTDTNWYSENSLNFNTNASSPVYRTGSVAISHAFRSPYNSKLMVTSVYESQNSRGQYLSLNEPRFDIYRGIPLDSTYVGMATDPSANYQGFTINNFANFKSGVRFTDVHNTSLEVNYTRGFSDKLGFRDGGEVDRTATVRFSGSFGNNGRAYKTRDFDIVNLRLFTSDTQNNLAEVTNFYAIRMESIRGVNKNILQNAWGVYMQPVELKNYFGGNVGIGTTNVTNALTVAAAADPLKITGLQSGTPANNLLCINEAGIVQQIAVNELISVITTPNTSTVAFLITTDNITISDQYALYIHEGGDATYTLPAPDTCPGKVWQIVNIGQGQITTSLPFYEGNSLRNTIINNSGANAFKLFSDGTKFIAI